MSFKYRGFLSLILLCAITPLSYAQPDRDLRSRIAIDGSIDDYTYDEWVLDPHTLVPESSGDSRWGLDNDIRRIAVTWDMYNLYVAVDCSIANTSVLVCIDCGCGGFTGLQDFSLVTRNIIFRGCTPNVLVHAAHPPGRPRAVYVDCSNAPHELSEDEYRGLLYQDEFPSGALEFSLPWELFSDFDGTGDDVILPAAGYSLRLLAAVSGGDATGAGDAAPNTTQPLDNDSTGVAVLDNHIVIPLDTDEDRMLDTGTSLRRTVTFAWDSQAGHSAIPDVTLAVDKKVFAPDAGELVRFRPVFETGYSVPAPVTARVYSVSGSLIKVLFVERTVIPESNSTLAWEEWDGRDTNGSIVPGGIYIIAVSVGTGGQGMKHIAKEAVAVIR